MAFDPPVVHVALGDTVIWTNDDPAPHDVAADDGQFASDILGTGDSHSQAFVAPETITYYCTIHPHMRGRVVVS
jgi:plastocyanin